MYTPKFNEGLHDNIIDVSVPFHNVDTPSSKDILYKQSTIPVYCCLLVAVFFDPLFSTAFPILTPCNFSRVFTLFKNWYKFY